MGLTLLDQSIRLLVEIEKGVGRQVLSILNSLTHRELHSPTKGSRMIEIRTHGRGGQGAVIASEILAEAFFREKKFVQAFPAFGVERQRRSRRFVHARFRGRDPRAMRDLRARSSHRSRPRSPRYGQHHGRPQGRGLDRHQHEPRPSGERDAEEVPRRDGGREQDRAQVRSRLAIGADRQHGDRRRVRGRDEARGAQQRCSRRSRSSSRCARRTTGRRPKRHFTASIFISK